MKNQRARILPFAAALVVIAAFLLQLACDSSGPIRSLVEEKTYYLQGVLVKEPNRNVSAASIVLYRNDTLVEDALVTVGNDTLPLDTISPPYPAYTLILGPADSLLLGDNLITVVDSGRFEDTVTSTTPGNLNINSVIPSVKGPADIVHVSWSAAANAEGYVIAAVKSDSTFTGDGYSQWVTTLTTSDAIDEDAFLRNTLQGPEPNPGIYYIYVYAYTGVPDSALSARWLPVPMPSRLADTANFELPDNILHADLNGHIGSIVVSYFGTVEVLASP